MAIQNSKLQSFLSTFEREIIESDNPDLMNILGGSNAFF